MSEDIEPEVRREITLQPFEVPEFAAHIKEADLADFDLRDRKMLLAMSVCEQRDAFILTQLALHTQAIRAQQAEQIRGKRWRFVLAKWAGTVAGAGAIGALVEKAVKKLWP